MTAGSMPGGQFDPAIMGFDAILSFAFGILGVYFIHTLGRGIATIPVVGACFQWVGKRSALFYLFHPIFLELSAIVIFQKKVPWGRAQAFFYLFVVIALMVLTFLLIELLVRKTKKKKEPAEAIAGQSEDGLQG